MSHNDTQPQEPKTREEYVRLADIAVASLNIHNANYYLLRALLAEPATPKEDGAALALLVALVSEYEVYLKSPGNDGIHVEFYQILEQSRNYVRNQAAKGEAGK